jgi:hypothetical protein
LDALIDPTSFLDLQGQPLQEADIEEATNIIIEAFGYPTDLFLGTRQLSDLVKTMYPRERIQLPAPTNGQIGQAINTMATQAGVIEFNPDIFVRVLPNPPAAATHPNAPNQPQAVIAAANATGNGDFTKGAPAAGNVEYAYVVTSCNRFGESTPSPFMAANVVLTAAQRGAGDQIDVSCINNAAVGAFPTEYFRVYRTRNLAAAAPVPGAVTDYSLVLQIPCTDQAAAGVTVANDLNFLLPFTSIAYLGELTPNVITFRQLAPMMRLDLAVLAPAYRWMILLYGTPLLFAPLKWLRLINIGTL